MKYVSVLTPPLLVCAVFLIGVIAFLRHEMGARRSRSDDPLNDNSSGDPNPSPEGDTSPQRRHTPDRPDDN